MRSKLNFIAMIFLLLIGITCWVMSLYDNPGYSIENGNFSCKYPLAVFSDSKAENMTKMVLRPNLFYPAFAEKTIWYDGGAPYPHIYRRITLYSLTPNRSLWYSPAVGRFQSADDKSVWLPYPIIKKDLKFLAGFFLLLALAVLLLKLSVECNTLLIKRISKYSALWVMWIALFLFTFYIHGFFAIYYADSDQYIRKAYNWLTFHWRFVPCASTGIAFIYMPFILLGGLNTALDMLLPYSIFSFLVYGGLGLVFLSIIASRLWKNSKTGIYTAVIACLFPYFFWILRKGSLSQEGFFAKSQLFISMNEHPFSMAILNKTHLMFWNAYQHGAECFMLILGFLAMVVMKRSVMRYVAMGLFFGFAMTVRYSAVAVLPAVFFLDLAIENELLAKRDYKQLFLFYLVFGLCGFIAFSPQFIDNYLTNGSPFKPIVLQSLYDVGSNEKQISNLMHFANILNGLRFYFTGHYKSFLLFALALFSFPDKKRACFHWLYFSGILVFYSSMNFHNTSIMRYMITVYPFIYITWGAAISLIEKRSALIITITVLLINFIIPDPEAYACTIPLDLPICCHFAIPALSLLIVIFFSYQKYLSSKNGIILSCFLIMLMLGQWYIILILLLLFPLWFFYGPIKFLQGTDESQVLQKY